MSVRPLGWETLTLPMADVAAASSVNFIAPIDATRLEVVTMLSGALAGGDATLTVSKNGTNLSPTIVITSSGSALGDIDSATFVTGIVKGDRITVTTDGGGNSTVPITINATFTP
jgi:hypothetical protein